MCSCVARKEAPQTQPAGALLQDGFDRVGMLRDGTSLIYFGRGQVTDLGVTVLHFSGPMKSGHFPWIVPLNFRENQGKDTICKMLKLQA